LEQAEQAGVEVILLEVRPSNTAAIQLYRDMQFNEVGIRPDYYPAVDGREDALIMARSMLRE
ncbi:MAG: ribosomal-protein-alanine N-acetyltransferase, partial [Proteobacteria bacterium]|nr:ribosomal-protein-alanine N-acetyltransferase [Pseudomonadota bacterium]